MAKALTHSIRLFGVIVLLGATASDQQVREKVNSSTSAQTEKHLYNYGSVDRTCIRWSDQCRTCGRTQSEPELVCSNIGIACQPTELECLERERINGKKE